VNVTAYGLADPFEPVSNIRAGVQILRRLLVRYKRTDMALAAYRSGPGNVAKRGIDRKDETYINAVRSAMAEHLIAVYTP
jgi:soluble lytic murein transglycosylase-like protein